MTTRQEQSINRLKAKQHEAAKSQQFGRVRQLQKQIVKKYRTVSGRTAMLTTRTFTHLDTAPGAFLHYVNREG